MKTEVVPAISGTTFFIVENHKNERHLIFYFYFYCSNRKRRQLITSLTNEKNHTFITLAPLLGGKM